MQLSPKHVALMSGKKIRKTNFLNEHKDKFQKRPVKSLKKLINHLTEKSDSEIQILTDLFQILSYNLNEYVKPGIIIMIHSALHDLLSPINATDLVSLLKAAV